MNKLTKNDREKYPLVLLQVDNIKINILKTIKRRLSIMPYRSANAKWYQQQILTVLKDGETVLEPYQSIEYDVSEFIVSGEGSDSPFNQWDCEYYLLRLIQKNVYALQLVYYGDLDNHSKEDSDPLIEIVAVSVEPKTDDENVIVIDLLQKYWDDGGYRLDFYHNIGKYELVF